MIEPGAKFDADKPRWDLLPLESLAAVVDVLTFGARKYTAGGWQQVPGAETRFFAAALRHLVVWRLGEHADSESGLPHLAHAAACLLFLMWFDGD